MPKIRGIKPDYWTDEDIVELSIPARLLFIGLWTYACDNGHLQDKPKQIKMRLFPGDDVSAADLLRELESCGKFGRIVREDGWITIPNFAKHQRPNKRYWLTCEKAGCTRPDGDSEPESPSAPTGTKGTKVGPTGATADGDGDGEVMVKVTKTSPRADALEESFEEFWTRYPRKVGKGAARKAWAKALKTHDADTITNAARSYAVRVHGSDPKFIPHASRWLNEERWLDEAEENGTEATSDGGWFQPFNPGIAPPEIADDPERYAAWLNERREAWRQDGGR